MSAFLNLVVLEACEPLAAAGEGAGRLSCVHADVVVALVLGPECLLYSGLLTCSTVTWLTMSFMVP